MPDGLSKEGGEGGPPSSSPSPSQSIMGPPSHWPLPSHVTLLFLYKKPPSHFMFSHSSMIWLFLWSNGSGWSNILACLLVWLLPGLLATLSIMLLSKYFWMWSRPRVEYPWNLCPKIGGRFCRNRERKWVSSSESLKVQLGSFDYLLITATCRISMESLFKNWWKVLQKQKGMLIMK